MTQSILQLICLLSICTLTPAVNPGLKLRLSEKGLDYGARIAVSKLSEMAKNERIPDQLGTASLIVGRVEYGITGMRITRFTSPGSTVTTDAGRGLTLKLSDAGIAVHGNWRYKYKIWFFTIRDHGTFDLSLDQISLNFAFTIGADRSGRPTISTRSCSSHTGNVKIKFHGGASWLYNLFSRYVSRKIARAVDSKLCDLLRKLVREDASELLRTFKVRLPVNQMVTVDYRLVNQPVYGSNFMESHHKGEFFWTSHQVEAPFQPKPIGSVPGAQKMVSICLSDYVGNSLGHAIYTYGRKYLRYHLTVRDLPSSSRGVLGKGTSLSPSKRLAGMIELDMYVTKAPTIRTSNNKIVGRFEGNVIVQLREPNGRLTTLLPLHVTILLDVSAQMSGQKITAKVNDFSILTNVTDAATTAILNPMLEVAGKYFIVPKLNAIGQKGFQLPALENFRYVSPDLILIEGAVCFKTNVQYNRPVNTRGNGGHHIDIIHATGIYPPGHGPIKPPTDPHIYPHERDPIK